MVTAHEYARIATKMANDAVSPEEARSNGAALGQLISAKLERATSAQPYKTFRAVVEIAFLALAVSDNANLNEVVYGALEGLGISADSLPPIQP